MGNKNYQIKNLSFSYPGSKQILIQNLNLELYKGWTAVIGENGAGKSTFLKLICQILSPDSGNLNFKGNFYYCEQNADKPPKLFEVFFNSYDKDRYKYQDKLGIDDHWYNRWSTLSWGERKRIQIAVALWKEPDLLALDEPTNHLDLETRNLLLKALKGYKGIGLLVSHDRLFLDELCTHSFSMVHRENIYRKGSYSESMRQKQQEETFMREKYDKLMKEKKKLNREMANRRQEASRANKKRSKKNITRHDSDSRFKINLARLSGKDGHDGKLLNQLNGRFKQLESKIKKINTTKIHKQGITISSEHSRKQNFFYSKALILSLGKTRKLHVPEISIQRKNRIALIGPNGAGKTSLLNYIYKNLQLDKEKVLFIPQEISQDISNKTIKSFQDLNNMEKGCILSEIDRLGSSAESFLDSKEISPGETKKLLFAMGFSRKIPLIIMDEPTNHLDINSIKSLEKALKSSDCTLLFVSHDQKFIDYLHEDLWEIKLVKQRATLYKKI